MEEDVERNEMVLHWERIQLQYLFGDLIFWIQGLQISEVHLSEMLHKPSGSI